MSGYNTKSGRRGRGIKRDASQMFKDGLNWDKYLQLCNLPAAPDRFFTQAPDVTLINKFSVNQKLEAQDPRNPTSICLATVILLQGPRILLRLDGSDKCNDFWRLVNSRDIYPLGTHESKLILLQPPLGYTKNVSTWASFLAKNRIKAERASEECFVKEPEPVDRNLFEIGMKLEAVDKKNPDLICPATIGDIKNDQIFISFDGWRGAIDYWCHYTSRDIFPVGWCEANDHPLSSPGTKGDNPAVVERLKIIAEESKRQTRSGASNQSELEKPLSNKAKTNEHSAAVTGPRIRAKARSSRSLTPVPRKHNPTEKPSEESTDRSVSPKRTKAPSPTATESSADEDTCDSSPSSSQQSSDSYSSEDDDKDATGDLRHNEIFSKENNGESIEKRTEDESLPETDKSVTADLEDLGDMMKCDYEKRRKSDKKSRKKKKKERKKLKKFSKHSNLVSPNIIHSKRKRFASMGDEERSVSKLKKRKKRKHKHSTSSLYDSPSKRMHGFGPPATSFTPSKTSLSSSSVQSPSFLDNAAPSSLFGLNREDIVKEATKGWPSGFLVGGPGKVVTSDNKLARFGSVSATTTGCQTLSESETAIKPQVENVVQGHVTTTTDIEENDEENASKECEKSVTMIDTDSEGEDNLAQSNENNAEVIKTISSQTVSSTTSPAQSTPPLENVNHNITQEEPASSMLMMELQETKVEKKRSRNPQRWSVRDVINYVSENEPALTQHTALFLFHEIDGQALLLLNSAIAVKYMNMKLGPALKLANLVEKLKQLVPPPHSSL